MTSDLIIRGAKEHNLKNLNLTIPRDKLIVFTGVSGSGKTSLAFDTIYAEGQRRYIDSLSSYARMFLGQMEKPNVDSIEGLSPAISIDQKTTSRNPRSTVGTVTEIYDYLRLLYARVGTPHCPECGREIVKQTVDDVTDKLLELPEGTRFQLMAPIVRGRKGEYHKELETARKQGFVRCRVDGAVYDLSEKISMDKNKKHTIEIIVDRLAVKKEDSFRTRLSDSIETATKMSEGILLVDLVGGEPEEILFSLNYACPIHGAAFEDLQPRMFSFNNPYGACPACAGLGSLLVPDEDLILPDKSLSLNENAIAVSGWTDSGGNTIARMYFEGLAQYGNFSLDTPLKDLPRAAIDLILWGTKGKKFKVERAGVYGSGTYMTDFEGIANNVMRRHKETTSDWSRAELESYMQYKDCPACKGKRLRPEVLAVTIGDLSITDFTDFSIGNALQLIEGLHGGMDGDKTVLRPRDLPIAEPILREIRERLAFLQNVGLGYLDLSRSAGTLSGGESQRIRLATQIGSSLMGVLYILDEPSIGLHQRDNGRLIDTLKHLRDLGNTLIVVEHDEDTMRAADHIVDIGPGAGVHGGELVCQGTAEELMACPASVTGMYLSGEREIALPDTRRMGSGKFLTVRGASENNLKHIDVRFPLGTFICVTGVSGSGKSTLVNDILSNTLARDLNRAHTLPGKCDGVDGLEYLDKVIAIDQSPIGRTPRSNPATYTGVFTDIRDLFAATADAKQRGYKSNRFSFNVKGGRCEACQGDGIVKIEMHFLPDIFVPCDTCKGARYNHETLEVRYKGKNISDVLEMTIEEALGFFSNIQKIERKLRTLFDVGLGYLKVGHPATQLSGGEAQRVKLAAELQKRSTGQTVYILDEPTTGLHAADVDRLVQILQRLTEAGNTIIVIEHNLDVIKTADYIIDLGPEGGDGGGEIVAEGTPEEVAACPASFTGQYLKQKLGDS
ncbi:MAG: excinuclease ABC subunit UvrA [Oscillospiraceae bacterium]|nr:excinuclease ABC subunit UvrA [Oscillospiraceae bacterium]